MYENKATLRKAMGKRLRGVREDFGMSREELSAELGITPNFLGLIERGGRGISAEKLVKICEIFQCTSDYLLTGKEKFASNIPCSPLAMSIDLLLNDNAKQKLSEFIKSFFAQYRE
jgi:transcriptional regulator with XRE-family HTH domain